MIDLSQLAPPTVIDSLSFETIFEALRADAIARLPELEQTLSLESEPVTILLQTCAYRELLLRQRINEAARGVMLAYALGTDLDQIGGNYGTTRLVIQPADPDAIPPVPAVMETDTAYRARILLSLERFSTAGSAGSYRYHAMSASGDVLDAQAVSPQPGQVTIYVLSSEGDGTASTDLLTAVTDAVTADHVRPLTDQVTVLSASVVGYAVTGHLVVSNGPDAETIRQSAITACQAYVTAARSLGQLVSLSGIYQALHQPGVSLVQLSSPLADILLADGQAAHCTGITITAGASRV